jgi:transposase-like protein
MLMHLNLPSYGGDPLLAVLTERHGSEGFRLYLERLRWPVGVECPRCESRDILWLERRRRYNCRECRYQFRVTAGTVFHDSHLSLQKWFLAIALMLGTERGISASRLQRILGGSYKTAWFLEHRIRSAMAPGTSHPRPPVAYSSARAVSPRTVAGRSGLDEEDAGIPAGWPLLRSLIAGAHVHVGSRYLTAYWNEVRWRDAQRVNPNAFRETVAALLEHPWLPFKELTGPEAALSAET